MDEEEVCMMTPFFPIVAGRLEFRLRNAATGKAPPRRNIKSTRMCDILWKEGKLLLLQEDLLEELGILGFLGLGGPVEKCARKLFSLPASQASSRVPRDLPNSQTHKDP